MWKRFYLLRSSMTGFGLQLRVHFPKSIKGEKKGKKKGGDGDKRYLPCKMLLIKSPGGSAGKYYKQNCGQSYSFYRSCIQ